MPGWVWSVYLNPPKGEPRGLVSSWLWNAKVAEIRLLGRRYRQHSQWGQLREVKLLCRHRGPSANRAEGLSCSPDILRSSMSDSFHRQQKVMWLPTLSKPSHQALSRAGRWSDSPTWYVDKEITISAAQAADLRDIPRCYLRAPYLQSYITQVLLTASLVFIFLCLAPLTSL